MCQHSTRRITSIQSALLVHIVPRKRKIIFYMKRYQIQLMCGIMLKQFVLLLLNYIQLWKLKLLHNQIDRYSVDVYVF